MKGWSGDVGGSLVGELDYSFTKVGLNNIQALLLEVLAKVNLLACHRFCFDDTPSSCLMGEA